MTTTTRAILCSTIRGRLLDINSNSDHRYHCRPKLNVPARAQSHVNSLGRNTSQSRSYSRSLGEDTGESWVEPPPSNNSNATTKSQQQAIVKKYTYRDSILPTTTSISPCAASLHRAISRNSLTPFYATATCPVPPIRIFSTMKSWNLYNMMYLRKRALFVARGTFSEHQSCRVPSSVQSNSKYTRTKCHRSTARGILATSCYRHQKQAFSCIPATDQQVLNFKQYLSNTEIVIFPFLAVEFKGYLSGIGDMWYSLNQ